jgi:hypothetical protein
MRNAYKVLVGKLEREKNYTELSERKGDNIKTDLKERG